MRLRDYFRGRRLVMQSRLRREELEQRIRARLLPRFRPFVEGVSGSARWGRLRLKYHPRLFEYNMGPVLVGRIDDQFGPARLDLRFRAPNAAYVFFVLWYVGFSILAIVAWSGRLEADGQSVWAKTTLLFLLLFPLGLHYLGMRNSEAHLAKLIEFLEREAEAKLVEDGRPGRP